MGIHTGENMIWDHGLHALLPRNPVIARDLRHQQRTTSFRMGVIETVGVVAVALCFSAAMLFYTVYKLHPWRWAEYLDGIQLLAWSFHAVATLRLLASG